ncbi:hypothetical protein HYV85_00370 [Candidatus Woesearchaeota archaeon]|nr:hypothetical protein [Candidatus Woesearchaeota archaeon]
MTGQKKDPFEGMGDLGEAFRRSPYFNRSPPPPQQPQQQAQPLAQTYQQQPTQPRQGLEEVVTDYVISSRKAAQDLISAVNKVKDAKEGRLTPEGMSEIGAGFGAKFEYLIRSVAKAYDAKSTLTADEIKKASVTLGINFEDFTKAAAKAKEAKNDAKGVFTASEIRGIGKVLGINLEDYAICQINLIGKQEMKVFYTGDKKPTVRPEDLPASILELAEPALGMCHTHQARQAINHQYKDAAGELKYGEHELIVIELWEQLNVEDGTKKLEESGLSDVEILAYNGILLKGSGAVSVKKQALAFPKGKYANSQMQRILTQLRGEAVIEKTQPAPQPAYSQPAVQPQPAEAAQAQTAASMEELLPKGTIEISQLSIKANYEGATYRFHTPALLNGIMALDGEEGYRINPGDAEEIIFTGRQYIAPEAKTIEESLRKAEEARTYAIRRLIGKDRRIQAHVSGELERTLEIAMQDQEKAKAIIAVVQKLMTKPQA